MKRAPRDVQRDEAFSVAFLLGEYGKTLEQLAEAQDAEHEETRKRQRLTLKLALIALAVAVANLFLPDQIVLSLFVNHILGGLIPGG